MIPGGGGGEWVDGLQGKKVFRFCQNPGVCLDLDKTHGYNVLVTTWRTIICTTVVYGYIRTKY